jgi:peptidoglycan/LPS O-acetylase OafA/YrhL
MARSTSTLGTMRAVSVVLFLTVAGLVVAGISQIRHHDVLTGTKLITWAFVPLAILLGFTLPVRCKVKRTNRQACGNWAYGLLFGCTKAAGHWTEKFRVRLRFPDREVKPVERRQPAGSYAQLIRCLRCEYIMPIP